MVSEGAVPVEGGDMTLQTGEKDAFGHVRLGGIGDRLANEIEDAHRQGGAGGHARSRPARRHADGVRPVAGDPVRAARDRRRSRDGDFGTMVALRGKDIIRVPLIEGTGELKVVSPEEYAEAEVFFG